MMGTPMPRVTNSSGDFSPCLQISHPKWLGCSPRLTGEQWDGVRERARTRLAGEYLLRKHHLPAKYLSRRKIVHPMKGRIPFELYRYQRELLASRAAQRIIVKARQTGVSQLIAGEALFRAKHLDGVTVLFVSRNLAAAQHLQRMVYQLMASDPNLPRIVRRNETEIHFGNESVIRSLPATEDTGRTFAASVVYLDEFAFMPWAERIYQAVAPCAARGGKLTIISTPYGRTNAFHRLWQEAGIGLNQFQRIRIHWSDCPEYNPEGWHLEDPEERRRVGEQSKWYQRERPRFSDEQWAHEFDCDFVGSGSLVYQGFDPDVHVGEFRYNPEWPAFAGQDFGYVQPSVALIIQVSPTDEVFVIREHYHTHRPVSELARDVYRPSCEQYGVQAWYCDPSGRTEIAELRAVGIPAMARRSTVEEGVLAIRKLVRPAGGGRPRLHIDRGCTRLIAELSGYGYREETDQIDKRDDHGPDALRYFVVNHWRDAARTEGMELR